MDNIFKEKRKKLKMNQKDFAKLIGTKTYRISKTENGFLSFTDAIKFCNAFPNEFEIRKMSVQKRITQQTQAK